MFRMKHVILYLLSMNTKKTGDLGEDIALKYLLELGYKLIERNYSKKLGELDLIVEKNKKIHFVEVKSVSYETLEQLNNSVSHGTWKPEDHVDARKEHKLSQIINTWLVENPEVIDFQVDILAVRIAKNEHKASIEFLNNIILK